MVECANHGKIMAFRSNYVLLFVIGSLGLILPRELRIPSSE